MADKEFKNSFSWSKSRDGVFSECRRKYYYTYYGYWGGWDSFADERVRQLYVLKKLTNRYMWLGSVVHDSIEGMIKEVQNGQNPNLYNHIAHLHNRMEREFNESSTGLHKKSPKYKLGLFEHEYELPISKDEWKETTDNAEKCLTIFFNSDVFQYIQSVDPSNYLLIEKLDKFDFEGTKVWVGIDFALKDGDNLLIFDWKTGKVRQVEMDVQLACYSLYSLEKFGYSPENILCKRYNVFLDVVDDFKISSELISNVKDCVRKSISSMKNLLVDVGENIAREDDFEVTQNNSTCKSCNFRKACSK